MRRSPRTPLIFDTEFTIYYLKPVKIKQKIDAIQIHLLHHSYNLFFSSTICKLTRSVYDFTSTELTYINWQLYNDGIFQELKLSNVFLNIEEQKIEIINNLCLSKEQVIRWSANAIWLKSDLWSTLNIVIVTAQSILVIDDHPFIT